MRMLEQPLHMSEDENREILRASEARLREFGSEDGNRHERRLAAKRARQEARKQRTAQSAE